MKNEIKETEIKKLNKIGGIYAVFLILTVITFVPFIAFMDWYGLIPWSGVYAIALYFAFKADKVKKENHLSTYKEIVAFTEGRRLDEIEEQQEIGKGSVFNFVSLPFHLIPEAGCGQSPQALINARFPANYSW